MIVLQPVTIENFDEIISLQVASEQKSLVASNAESIGQAYVQPNCYPFGIYANGVAVGFLMYCLDSEDGEYWLYRMMVDERFQRQGYGEAALRQMIKLVKRDPTRNKIYLGVDLSGAAAPALYKKLGFCFDGRTFGKEHVMLLEY